MDLHLNDLLARRPELTPIRADLEAVRDCLCQAFAAGHRLYICGNGGSAADSEHVAGELMKAFLVPRPLSDEMKAKFAAFGEAGVDLAARLQQGLPAIALTNHSAIITAVDNDQGPDLIYAQQVMALGRPGDVLLGISTSGKSRNVCHAVRAARVLGLHTVSLTGEGGGDLAVLSDLALRAPAGETQYVQELHLPIYHYLCAAIEKYFYA